MRVAIDTRLLAYQSAGTSTYIRGIVQGLTSAEPGLDLLAIASRKERSASGPGGIRRQFAWTPCHHRWEHWALGLELANLSVDVLHSPDFIPPARFGRAWARVITVHDLAFLRFPELLTTDSQRYYGQIDRATAEAERIIAVSESTREDLLTLVSSSLAEKIEVVPEGVDPEFAPGDTAGASALVGERFGVRSPYFLFVGTIEPRKNLPRLIRAFGAFRERAGQPDVCLVLAGGRGWLAEETDRALATVASSVRAVGRVTSDELIALYRGAVALVLMSRYEGFGLPVLEAMACGTPVLVARVGSLPELAGDAGMTVDPEDEDAISAGLHQFWGDPAARQLMADRGIERARDYRWSVVGKQTAQVYRQAAACGS